VVVHVVPRARASGVAGWHGDAVKVRVTAPPTGGAANAELVELVADKLGVASARVSIVAGATGRRKRVSVAGLPAAEIRRRLVDVYASGSTERALNNRKR
jgi:uncharacterized protein (TIGR00251 family)